MQTIKNPIYGLACLTIFGLTSCAKKEQVFKEIKHYPVSTIEGLIEKSDIQIDQKITSDGTGALYSEVQKPKIIKLYETGNIDIENAVLIYQAKIRTEDIKGTVYLEMWCRFPEKGEYFSRSLYTTLSGSNEWTQLETPFFLKKGENPDNVKLNLVVNGTGKVWIDDIRLLKSPLK